VERRQTAVDDEMVERRLLELRERLAQVEPVEREVRVGDVVVGDLKVFLRDGDQSHGPGDAIDQPEREVAAESRTAAEIEVREGSLIPELLAALPGRRVGEVAVAELTFPEDHPDEALRGRPGRLEVTVQGVKEKRVPELTDEVAEELSGGEQKQAEALRVAVREDLVVQAKRLDELTFEQAAVKALVEGAQVDVPQALVEREVDRQLEDMDQRLRQRGLRLDRYLEYLNKTEAEHRAELQPDAEGRIRVDLVLEELGKQMAIAPSDDEVTEYMRSEAEKEDELRTNLEQLLKNRIARDYFGHRLTRLKVLEGLVSRLGGAAVADQKLG
jgi:trigger factor